jgi:hypothetical protein
MKESYSGGTITDESLDACLNPRMAEQQKWGNILDHKETIGMQALDRCTLTARLFDAEIEFPPQLFPFRSQIP